MWIATPFLVEASPHPAMVVRPSTKVTCVRSAGVSMAEGKASHLKKGAGFVHLAVWERDRLPSKLPSQNELSQVNEILMMHRDMNLIWIS